MGLVKKLHRIMKQEVQIYCPISVLERNKLLSDRVIVITGGASGIGKALAYRCINCGAKVIIVGRRSEKLFDTAKELGKNCEICVADVNSLVYNKWFFELEKIFDMPILGFSNNAGVYIDKKNAQYTLDDLEYVFATNLKSIYMLTQAFCEYCVSRNISGNVVITDSNRGLMGDHSPYGISKAAVINLMQGFAKKYVEKNIRVNAVAPGMTASEINNVDTNGDMYAEYIRGKRIIRPEEIAEIIAFMLSDLSKCINGVIIPCDNGDYLR